MNETETIEQLKYAIQALSLEAEEQISLFPNFVVVTDELLLEFDNWYSVVIQNYASSFSTIQRETFDRMRLLIDLPKSEIYASEKEELLYSEFWCDLRKKANEALTILNWKKETPPEDRGSYIKG